jgi:glycine oxidase
MNLSSDICIIGGGIAGLCCARSFSRAGASVTLLERDTLGSGASRVAAGMLAPLVEARLEERNVVGFGAEALRFYPDFVEQLQSESDIDVGLRREGTLLIAFDRDEAEMLRHLSEEHQALGLPVEALTGFECRRIEPHLSVNVPAGLFSSQDLQIDNRMLLVALERSCRRKYNVQIVEHAGEGAFDVADGVDRYRTDRVQVTADRWIIATGASNSVVKQLLPSVARSIRPVKGQILRLDQSASPLLEHVVRSPRMYLVPKPDGRLVLGASSEDRGFDPNITAGEIYRLLRAAWECLPGIYELPIVETSVGFRPATIDHAPLLGDCGIGGISLAMGYYRHGILFSPYAAELLAEEHSGGSRSRWLDTFSPERFDEAISQR